MKFLPLAVMLAIAGSAHAGLKKGEPSLKQVQPLVSQYLNAISCPGSDVAYIDPKNIVRFKDPAIGIGEVVLVVSSTDMTCAGGTGTFGSVLVVLRMDSGRAAIDSDIRYLKVDTELSEPQARADKPGRSLTSVRERGGVLYATFKEHGPKDPNCCPNLVKTYKMSLTRKTMALSASDKRDAYTWVFTPVAK